MVENKHEPALALSDQQVHTACKSVVAQRSQDVNGKGKIGYGFRQCVGSSVGGIVVEKVHAHGKRNLSQTFDKSGDERRAVVKYDKDVNRCGHVYLPDTP